MFSSTDFISMSSIEMYYTAACSARTPKVIGIYYYVVVDPLTKSSLQSVIKIIFLL